MTTDRRVRELLAARLLRAHEAYILARVQRHEGNAAEFERTRLELEPPKADVEAGRKSPARCCDSVWAPPEQNLPQRK